MDKSKKIENYFNEEHQFNKAIGILREIALKTELEETFKWAFPTYTLTNKNVLSICKFKNHFGIWFFNGVFLSDPLNVLENAQEGKTKAMRHWKFTRVEQINKNAVLAYMTEATENQKKGRVQTIAKSSKKIVKSALLSKNLAENSDLKSKFNSFSTYKQKEFHEYIATAKQEKTKIKRLEKILPMILEKKGLNDKYK